MTTSYAFVALLDVLGYRAHLARDKQTGTTHFQTQLQKSLSVLSDLNENEIQYQAISDTIIFTTGQHENFNKLCDAIRFFFRKSIENKLFIRGGISFGQYFKSAHVTYSHALAKSYQLESQNAIYPRILVDANIVTMAQEDPRLTLSTDQLMHRNGTYFINPVLSSQEWEETYSALLNMYEHEKDSLREDERAFHKHVWIQNFLLNHPKKPDNAQPYIELFRCYPQS